MIHITPENRVEVTSSDLRLLEKVEKACKTAGFRLEFYVVSEGETAYLEVRAPKVRRMRKSRNLLG